MLSSIPIIEGSRNFRFPYIFDGEERLVGLRYNTRMKRWIFSLAFPNGEPIIAGIPVVTGVDLFIPFRAWEVPRGSLIVINTIDPNGDVGPDDLGTTCKLMYEDYT